MGAKKELKKLYQLIGTNSKDSLNAFCLYDLSKKGNISLHPYVGTVTIMSKGYLFNNTVYKDVLSLKEAIDTYNNTLEFSSEYYNPLLKEDYRDVLKLNTYIESLGFKRTSIAVIYSREHMDYSIQDLYNIPRFEFTVSKKFDEFTGNVNVYNNSSVITVPFIDLESAILAVNTIIKPNILYLMPMLLANMKDKDINLDNISKETVTNNFSLIKKPLKSLIKEELTKVLKSLED